MGFAEVKGQIKFPPGADDRYKTLYAYRRMLENRFYEDLPYPFGQEDDGVSYIELHKRRPSVTYNVARIITDQTAGLLFGDEQSPLISVGDGQEEPSDEQIKQNQAIEALVLALDLDSVMLQAYEAGQVGSCAIIIRRTKDGTPDFDVIDGEDAFPDYDPLAPAVLTLFTNLYPTTGADLLAIGVKTSGDKKPIVPTTTYWVKIEIDASKEVRFKPLPDDERNHIGEKRFDGSVIEWIEDATYTHAFGVVPVIWIKNLVAKSRKIDGPCTFGAIADNVVEIDYLLSQIGRGYRFTADPMLFLNKGEMANQFRDAGIPKGGEQRTQGGKRAKTPGMVIEGSGANADAKILEIAGTGLKAADEWLDKLREWSIEVLGGMKADADNEKGPSSGRAIEMLYQVVLLLVKRQRIAFGRKGFLALVRLIQQGVAAGAITVPDVDMRLLWPSWMTPSGADLVALANAAQTLAGGSPKAPVLVLPPDVVTRYTARQMGFTDPNGIAKEAVKGRAEMQQRQDDQAQAELDAKAKAPAPKGNA